MKPAYFPIYDIRSDLVKSALGLKDNRSVEKWLNAAGITIHNIGTRRVVKCEDLFNVSTNESKGFVPYESKGKYSKQLDELL